MTPNQSKKNLFYCFGADCRKTTVKFFMLLVVGVLFGLIMNYGGCGGATPTGSVTPPGDANSSCPVTSSVFNGWFESGTASLNGMVTPANSLQSLTSNCAFYEWSERMFLWLTSPTPIGGGRIFNSDVFYDVSALDAFGKRNLIPHVPGLLSNLSLRAAQVDFRGLQIMFDKTGKLFEIAHPMLSKRGKQLLLNEKGDTVEIERITRDKNGFPKFFGIDDNEIERPRPIISKDLDPKTTATKFVVGKNAFFLDVFGKVIETELNQAGGNGVLMSQNNSLVYYISMVNDVYAYFLTGVKNGLITQGTPGTPHFPNTRDELDQVIDYANRHGKTIPNPEALVIEVKSSWVKAEGLPNLNTYITITAKVPKYRQTSPNIWIPFGEETVQLALVGMHVVGSTLLHPEMVWATFEHKNNTPNGTYSYNNPGGTQTVNQSTAGTWLFCADNAPPQYNEIHMKWNPENGHIESSGPFTISPSNTIRWKAWGNTGTSVDENTEVISINNSVRGLLDNNDVRKNYIMIGATWTDGNAPAPDASNHKGTTLLSNSTMETYQQGNDNINGGTNCFNCHTTNTVKVSHIFDDIKPLFP